MDTWRDGDHHFDLEDLDVLQIDDGGDTTPPVEPPRRGGGGGPPTGRGHDAHMFSPWMTVVILASIVALVTVELLIMSAGAQGGEPMVYLLSSLFGVVFLGPFVGGSIWFGRLRRANDP